MQELKPHERAQDTNTLLQNKSTEWSNAADLADAMASDKEGRADEMDRSGKGRGDALRGEAEGHRSEAKRHRDRAEHAAKGRLLVDPSDLDWQLKNHGLHVRCAADGRLTYAKGTVRTQ